MTGDRPLRLRVDRTWNGRPLAAAEAAEVTLAPHPGGGLRLTVEAPYHGDPPPAHPPGATPRLWEHEVVELFVAGPGDDDDVEYLEVELGPHGHHLVLRLRGLRWVIESGRPLRYEAVVEGGRWKGEAVLPRAWLPEGPHRAAAFAVCGVQGVGEGRRYQASVELPGEEPDFHQPAAFVEVVVP